MRNYYPKPSVAFDLDGTLCRDTRNLEPGEPTELVTVARTLIGEGFTVVINTSRSPTHHPEVSAWLTAQGLADVQVCYGKPNVDFQVDDRGFLSLPEVVEEAAHLSASLLTGVTPAEVYEVSDPVSAYRSALHDVGERFNAPPDVADPFMRVVIPLTGGLDSVTAYAMALELDLPVETVYVDWGQDWASAELATARIWSRDIAVIHRPLNFSHEYQHIQVGRNPAFLHIVGRRYRKHGFWGEIWTGTRGDETKLRAGDKSIQFHVHTSLIFAALNIPFTIQHPLAGLTKVDLVNWWAIRGRVDEALETRTCFSAGDGHCGECWACFQRWAAFTGAGFRAEVEATMPTNFGDAQTEFRRKAASRQRSGRDIRMAKAMEEWR